ncbi:MAG: multidrug transporter AcrB [Firmicutes bacterium]|nr:multidrug transporter AcrB [Bacillota bacterium]
MKAIADKHGGRVKVTEIPPGPPVLSTLVAEVYGPNELKRREIAAEIMKIFNSTPGVVDVDWLVEADQEKVAFRVDRARAMLSGVSSDAVARTVAAALGGANAGLVHMETEKEPVDIHLQLATTERSNVESLLRINVPGANGRLIPLGELVTVERRMDDKTRYRKNLQPVTYVLGDVAGREESPFYAILQMKERLRGIKLPEGYALEQLMTVMPERGDRYAMKWDGEMQITTEVFHDLGIAFAAVLLLIYVLVVAWFRSFVIPVIIMIPIPLTLVGILPGHWIFGSFFTATSMIGFIALSGIIVRNSILLVDFIRAEERQGVELRQAVVRAGAVRLRPIALTAAAVVVASLVMLFDPIFQGLAISMMFGAVVATVLTLIAVPIMYYEWFSGKGKEEKNSVS